MNAKVSVIIPCYNAGLYVENAVLSIMNQTYSNLQIICIDDGSTDNTYKILNKLATQDKRIFIVRNSTNLKLIKTLNLGIELSDGDFIARMDSDDISSKDRIEIQLKYLKKNDLDICGTFTTYYFENRVKKISKRLHIVSQPKSLELYSLFDTPLIHPSVLGKSTIFKKFKYNYSEESYLIEDYELWCRMIVSGVKIGVVPEYLFQYRINIQGESQTKKVIQVINHLSLSQKMIQKITCLVIPKDSVSLISGFDIKQGIKWFTIKNCISDLYKVFNCFITTNTLTLQELKELKRWVKYKEIYVLAQGVKKGCFKTRLISALFLSVRLHHLLMCYFA